MGAGYILGQDPESVGPVPAIQLLDSREWNKSMPNHHNVSNNFGKALVYAHQILAYLDHETI